MSRVYFHSPMRTVEVQGAERHICGGIMRRFYVAMLRHDSWDKEDPLLNFIPDDSYAKNGDNVELYLGGGGDLIVDGKRVDQLHAALNTAICGGSRSVVFAARLHAQCECHAYVEGWHRSWLADVIKRALKDGILRMQPDDMQYDRGWFRVMAFLRERDDEPVVTSFSVCRQFPNAHIEGEKGDDEDEAFRALPIVEQWRIGMNAIRKIRRLEWHPATFCDAVFGSGDSAFSLREYAEEKFPRKDSVMEIYRKPITGEPR